MTNVITVFWSEDAASDRAVIARPALKHAALIQIARHGGMLEQTTLDWLDKRVAVIKSELRDWFTDEGIRMRPWIDTQPVSHWYAQLDPDQQFAFRMRWL